MIFKMIIKMNIWLDNFKKKKTKIQILNIVLGVNKIINLCKSIMKIDLEMKIFKINIKINMIQKMKLYTILKIIVFLITFKKNN